MTRKNGWAESLRPPAGGPTGKRISKKGENEMKGVKIFGRSIPIVLVLALVCAFAVGATWLLVLYANTLTINTEQPLGHAWVGPWDCDVVMGPVAITQCDTNGDESFTASVDGFNDVSYFEVYRTIDGDPTRPICLTPSWDAGFAGKIVVDYVGSLDIAAGGSGVAYFEFWADAGLAPGDSFAALDVDVEVDLGTCP